MAPVDSKQAQSQQRIHTEATASYWLAVGPRGLDLHITLFHQTYLLLAEEEDCNNKNKAKKTGLRQG